MIISKQPQEINRNIRSWFDFPRARDAFEVYLRSLNLSSDECILLPNYIGYSAREGSGVFDPVIRSGVNYRFYKLGRNLEIDLSSLANVLQAGKVRLLLLIHYFGYVDPNYRNAIAMARREGVVVLEDQAHSLFTDLHGGITGRLCSASIYSLHKMFPVVSGGSLSIMDTVDRSRSDVMAQLCLDHDISRIASVRRHNATLIRERLEGNEAYLTIMRASLDHGIVPQTFPILINKGDRNSIYFKMNDLGYGVVSLYHTMIPEIAQNPSFLTNEVSRKILNLPVHQDITDAELIRMCDALLELLHSVSQL